jgi:LCP family protein required for cell wall assembly
VTRNELPRRRPRRSPGRQAVRLVAQGLAVLVVLTAVGAVAMWSQLATVAPRSAVTDLGELAGVSGPAPGSLAWKIQDDRRVNILLLARGGAGRDDPDFTDTVLVLSIRPSSGRAAVVALPRFMWVDMPALVYGDVSGKLYSAYALGGQSENTSLRTQWRTATGSGDLASATVAGVIGQPIDAWVAVGIDAFRTMVDALGGIALSVPAPLDDPTYPVDETSGRTIHIHFEPGPQAMDGARALQYARSRLSTSETDRTNRQLLVASAILDRLRAVRIGPGLLPLIGALGHGALTNLRLADLPPLQRLARRVQLSGISRLTVDETNLLRREPLPDNDYLLLPRDATLVELHRSVAAALP